MNFKKEEVRNYISFLMDDALRPAAIVDLKGTIMYVNDSFREKVGTERTGYIQDFMNDQSIALWNEFSSQVNRTGRKTIEMEIKLTPDRVYLVKVQLMYFEKIQQIVVLFYVPQWGISVAEKAYFNAFRNAESFMVVVDSKGIIYDVNELHNDYFNLPRDYFVGQHFDVIVCLLSIDPKILSQNLKDIQVYGFAEKVIECEKVPGEVRHYSVTVFFDNETKMYLVRMKDCTENKVLEERLAHTGSLSALGELAASIAHEIRNPMTTLKGFTQLLKVTASEDSIRYISVIEEEIRRMESILGEMLLLSKPALKKETTFSLETLINDMIQLFYPKAIMEGITIVQKENSLEDTLIVGEADKIKQVLLNLFKNAFEAMSKNGVLTIGIEQDVIGQIVLTIADTGKGMNKNQINRAFVSFFTSKAKGTGLGLPFVLKVVEEHGGSVNVESEVGNGTTFILSFPSAIAHVQGKFFREDKALSS
ncbi:ATP-binding protein [Sporosarcina limicola]|uniref:histidine kinase n=1 Tax=Sporosarcina limicola TaxID=34101 RepID=A0A927MLY9_9BACL|nr:ATP-binding protein [Sporosarcina limicola]MBE1553646.1 two-component system, sporulation sensor kinase E [Sporosarcina limicola]